MASIVKSTRQYGFLLLLLLANLSLLFPPTNLLRITGAILLIGLLPGWLWAMRLLAGLSFLTRCTIAAALSYSLTSLITLLLHYLPGPILTWQLLVILNLVALLPLSLNLVGQIADLSQSNQTNNLPVSNKTTPRPTRLSQPSIPVPLLIILLIALFLRAANLHYSEFQGDEALAMITAAEAIEGHDDALFLRSKGPGEVLLPMALWRLTGTINEATARLPFTIASMFAIVTICLIGQTWGGQRVGWLAAGFFAFSGFMVAFGRIVQYQALVVWFSGLAFLLAAQWLAHRQNRLVLLSGLFLGIGLLAHYDAILVLPAVGWLYILPFLTKFLPQPISTGDELASETSTISKPFGSVDISIFIKTGFSFLITLSLPALLFYLPFALDPQANRTGDYVGGRIGNELRNNLPDFFHFNTFYSSFYYISVTGILVLFVTMWLLWHKRWSRATGLVLGIVALAVVFKPDLLATAIIDLSILPFALLLLIAFLASVFALASLSTTVLASLPALLIWLAVPFLGYNFVVALGLTHIYTIVPAWSLLAALGWVKLVDNLPNFQLLNLSKNRWASSALVLSVTLSTIFLWNAFVRHDVAYWQDYPDGNLAFFWTPYESPLAAGFFGFVHRAGWKAIGQQIDDGLLAGDYGSNEEPDVTTWYTRGAPRACDPQPEFYFLADDLVDRIDTPADIIANEYQQIGLVTLPNQKQMQIMQQWPPTLQINEINEVALARSFDQTATPAAFARSARGSQPSEVDFGSTEFGPLVRLVGYDLDTRRAYPGGRVPVTLYWQTLAEFPASYQIFTHLESDSGPVAQADGIPVCWTYPTDTWRPGQIIADQHALTLAPDLQPGSYPLTIGLYLPDTFERLDQLDIAGNPAGTSLTLDVVEIRNEALEVRN